MALDVNRLIGRLPRTTRNRLLKQCESVDLQNSQTVFDSSEHVYFPTRGVLSMWTAPSEPPVFEFALVGNEGMLGAHVALGVSESGTYAHVQAAGVAWRMPVKQFKLQLKDDAPLQRSVFQYIHVAMSQAIVMARCSRFHALDQRLARWLLMMQDRVGLSTFTVTQESMAGILGVRRVGVTLAATQLQRLGIIEYSRGRLCILDTTALKATACACYEADLHCYDRFLA